MAGRAKREFAEYKLSRRERQIMAVIYQRGHATVADIVANIPEPPSADAVRRMAHILEEKGLLRHKQDGPRNVFRPTVTPEKASKSVLDHVVDNFFGGSTHKVVAALLDMKRDELSADELRRLSAMIDSAAADEDRR